MTFLFFTVGYNSVASMELTIFPSIGGYFSFFYSLDIVNILSVNMDMQELLGYFGL